MASPPKQLGQYYYPPYMVGLNLDEFMIGKPAKCSLDHDPFINNEIISAHMVQKPSSSSSSSSPIMYENPNTKLAADNHVWDDRVRSTCFPHAEMRFSENNQARFSTMEEEEEYSKYWNKNFLHAQAPLMTKIDQEYLDWQRQQLISTDHLMQSVEPKSQCFDFDKINVVDFGDLEKTMSVTTADSPLESEKNGVFIDERAAKSAERRQRRMIKNRESAAKSRARKQAYINQLKQDVSQLEASNKLLRKRKEVDAILNSKSISSPTYQLRRTSSSQF